MFHDPDARIAANLAAWQRAWQDGSADLTGLKPALIWCKIVELQPPPSRTSTARRRPGTRLASEVVTPDEIREMIDASADRAALVAAVAADLPEDDGATWPNVLDVLSRQMPRQTFDVHLRNSHLVAVDENRFIVSVASDNSRDWLANRLNRVVEDELRRQAGPAAVVEFVAG